MASKLVAARVLETDFSAARGVFEAAGMTVSQAIQKLMAVTSQTGEVPACLAGAPAPNEKRAEFDALMGRVSARPRVAWPADKTDDDLLFEERMRRFG